MGPAGPAGAPGAVGTAGPAGAIYAGMGAGLAAGVAGGGGAVVMGAGGAYFGGAGGGGLAYTPVAPSVVTFDPTSGLSMRVNGHKAPMTDVFMNCRDVFLTDVQLCNDIGAHFHFLVWETIHDNEVRDYGSVLRSEDGLYIAFGSERSRTEFQEWMKNYARRFFPLVNLSDHKLPAPRPGDLKGVYVPDYPNENPANIGVSCVCGVRDTVFKDWVWIAANCYQQVYRIGDGWLFERDAEAIHFKMR